MHSFVAAEQIEQRSQGLAACALEVRVAFDDEPGVVVRDPAGNYAAISVPVPTLRFKQHQNRIAARLIAAKRGIEGLLTTAEAAE